MQLNFALFWGASMVYQKCMPVLWAILAICLTFVVDALFCITCVVAANNHVFFNKLFMISSAAGVHYCAEWFAHRASSSEHLHYRSLVPFICFSATLVIAGLIFPPQIQTAHFDQFSAGFYKVWWPFVVGFGWMLWCMTFCFFLILSRSR